MGQEIQLKLNNNNVSPTVEKVGDGNLQGFTATDLTGAANELKNTLNQLDAEVGTAENSIAIIITGNTASVIVNPGQYVLVKNSTISGISDGLYIYTGTTKTAGNTFVSGELSAVSFGGFNDINTFTSKETLGSGSCSGNTSTTVSLSKSINEFKSLAFESISSSGATIYGMSVINASIFSLLGNTGFVGSPNGTALLLVCVERVNDTQVSVYPIGVSTIYFRLVGMK